MGRKKLYTTPLDKAEAVKRWSKTYYHKKTNQVNTPVPNTELTKWKTKYDELKQQYNTMALKANNEINYLVDQLKKCGCKRK